MSMLSGPKLNELRDQLIDWYLDTRKKLIAELEEGYPYGSKPLTTDKQIERFVSMTPDDWAALTDKLIARHRGEPNQQELVQKDLMEYQQKMYSLMGRRSWK